MVNLETATTDRQKPRGGKNSDGTKPEWLLFPRVLITRFLKSDGSV